MKNALLFFITLLMFILGILVGHYLVPKVLQGTLLFFWIVGCFVPVLICIFSDE